MSHLITTATYKSVFEKLDGGVLRQNRTHLFKQKTRLIDVFSHLWGWGIGEFSADLVSFNRRGKTVPVIGRFLMVGPPFSVIDWTLGPGLVEWTGYFTFAPFVPGLPTEVSFANWTGRPNPESVEQLVAACRDLMQWCPASAENFPNAVAERTKQFLSERFSENISMAEVARELRYSHAVMTRLFTRNYGLSPITFRNRVRVFESLGQLLTSGDDISTVSRRVGFSSVSRFDKHFRNFSSAVPSNFRM